MDLIACIECHKEIDFQEIDTSINHFINTSFMPSAPLAVMHKHIRHKAVVYDLSYRHILAKVRTSKSHWFQDTIQASALISVTELNGTLKALQFSRAILLMGGLITH